MRSFKQFKARLLRDREFRKEYERLGPEFELVRLLIRKRLEKGRTHNSRTKE